jgi:putative nucleotidyltransferase with HDIG domain
MAFDLEQAVVDLVARDAVKVPPYPAVAFQIEKLVQGGDYGLDDLARVVASDQVICADVLRCANSAVYLRGAPVASVKAAVGRIGAKDVARIALASALGPLATAPGRLASLRRKVWLDALSSALLCQALARGRSLAPDVAFSAGLLHDFGKIVAIAALEELIGKHPDVSAQPLEAWTALVDRFHVELGVVMAARWELPQVLADVVSLHHADGFAGCAEPRLVETVAAADELVSLLADRPSLPPEELGLAALVSPTEHDVVTRAIQTLPAFVASFESGDAWRPVSAESLVTPPPRPAVRREAPKPPAFPVMLSLAGKRHEYRILGVASTHLMLSGANAVPENLLLEMTVAASPPLTTFASVKLAWPEGDRYSLLVQPYALSGDAARRWREIVATTAEAA